MTTLKITCPASRESLLVRCDLSRSESPIQVNYCVDESSVWEGTQYQCADARHTDDGLAAIGRQLLCEALETEPGEKYETFAELIKG
jgi:hypothetical protein